LFHGAAGVGKQRLALWFAQLLVCDRAFGEGNATGTVEPCGVCQQCRFARELAHPDVLWVFPRPRLKESDASVDDVRADLAAGAKARLDVNGLYPPPSGSDGIYVATIRAIVRQASLTPAMARRKVIIVGDAERMVSQEGADQAANTFLKLLEEPPRDTFAILTSSQPAALLPTIRSRVVAVRVSNVSDKAVEHWLADEHVSAALSKAGIPKGESTRVSLAAGAPGRLLSSSRSEKAAEAARRLLDSLDKRDQTLNARVALSQSVAGARGSFTDVLEALTEGLRARMESAARAGDVARAHRSAIAIARVEVAKREAYGNLNPQLVTAGLLEDLTG
jgi:DNA polymerase-3 subunit delta'